MAALTVIGAAPRQPAIADRLRRAIEASGQSIRNFQRSMQRTSIDGTSYPAINRALKGETVPSVDFLVAAAGLLSVRPAWLIVGDGPMRVDAANDGLRVAVSASVFE